MLGVGVWMYVDPGTLNEFMGKYSFKVPSAILMGAGAIVAITGFCGCAGGIKESKCLLGSVSQTHLPISTCKFWVFS